MPPNPAPGTAQEWMSRARGKMALARLPLPSGGYWEDLCFWAQQAAELAIKAVYQQHGWIFPYVHDLRQLLDGLQQQGLSIPPPVREAERLSIYAALARYPGMAAPVPQTKYDEAVPIAAAVLAWAESFVP